MTGLEQISKPLVAHEAVVGLAGHIDHGKTTLLQALTATQAVENATETTITVDLAFASLVVNQVRLALIDVPGHERYIKNMVAGAHGIDLLLLVVAADRGMQPQTLEHLLIADFLGIRQAVVALNKIDRCSDDVASLQAKWQQQVQQQLPHLSWLQQAAVVPVSAREQRGLDELRQALAQAAQNPAVVQRQAARLGKPARLYIDRVFSKAGHGTVVTGSVWHGAWQPGMALRLQPSSVAVQIKAMESFGQTVQAAKPGMRLALNIDSQEKLAVQRGDALGMAELLRPSKKMMVQLHTSPWLSAPLKHNQRLRLLHGCREVNARLRLRLPGSAVDAMAAAQAGFAVLEAEAPLAVKMGDRLLLRIFSPAQTVAGAMVLAVPDKQLASHWNLALLQLLLAYAQQPELQRLALLQQLVEGRGVLGATTLELAHFLDELPATLQPHLASLVERGGLVQQVAASSEATLWVSSTQLQWLQDEIVRRLHAAMQQKIPQASLNQEALRQQIRQQLSPALCRRALQNLVEQKRVQLSADGHVQLPGVVVQAATATTPRQVAQPSLSDKLLALIEKAGFTPLNVTELSLLVKAPRNLVAGLIKGLERQQQIYRLPQDFYLHQQYHDHLFKLLQTHFSKQSSLTMAEFKQLMQLPRKYVVPLLEFCDAQKWTLRTPSDERKPGAKLTTPSTT